MAVVLLLMPINDGMRGSFEHKIHNNGATQLLSDVADVVMIYGKYDFRVVCHDDRLFFGGKVCPPPFKYLCQTGPSRLRSSRFSIWRHFDTFFMTANGEMTGGGVNLL